MSAVTRRMLMMSAARNNQRNGGTMSGYDSPRYEGDSSRRMEGGSYVDNRFRYDPSRGTYDNGGEPSMGYESRFTDRQGRERYDDGRYARMGYDTTSEYTPPRAGTVVINPLTPPDREYIRRSGEPQRTMYRIGFGAGEEYPQHGKSEYQHRDMNEMERRSGGKMQKGHGSIEETPELNKHRAMEYAQRLEGVDGTRGPRWPYETAEQLCYQVCPDCEPAEFFLVLNMMYADYCEVFRRYGLDTLEVYAEMAKAWIKDPDGGKDKTAKYFEKVV